MLPDMETTMINASSKAETRFESTMAVNFIVDTD
jgi:hypothetical protein